MHPVRLPLQHLSIVDILPLVRSALLPSEHAVPDSVPAVLLRGFRVMPKLCLALLDVFIGGVMPDVRSGLKFPQ